MGKDVMWLLYAGVAWFAYKAMQPKETMIELDFADEEGLVTESSSGYVGPVRPGDLPDSP